jgi:hypothetical protein
LRCPNSERRGRGQRSRLGSLVEENRDPENRGYARRSTHVGLGQS